MAAYFSNDYMLGVYFVDYVRVAGCVSVLTECVCAGGSFAFKVRGFCDFLLFIQCWKPQSTIIIIRIPM